MTNTINQPDTGENRVDMWRFPAGFSDSVEANIVETQQRNYIDYMAVNDRESRAVESGQPLAPVREGNAVNQYETLPTSEQQVEYSDREGTQIEPSNADDVLARANQVVTEALQAPEEHTVRLSQEHHRQANQQATEYGPRLEMLREQALRSRDSYDLAA